MSKKGFSLIEMIVYVAIVALIFIVVMQTVLIISTSWGNARAKRNVINHGGAALERMIREIRLADSVDVSGSTLGTNPGRLRLNTIVSPSDTSATTREFFLSASTTMMAEGVLPDTELTAGVRVTNLTFYYIDNGDISEAVRVEMTVEDGVGRFEQSENFYGTAVLRRSY